MPFRSSAYAYFNPRAPYGARPGAEPLGGREYGFQSTRPIRGATPTFPAPENTLPISIHAPHTGRDPGGCTRSAPPCPFQSTRPIRGATDGACYTEFYTLFQSTRPIRGATLLSFPAFWPVNISIHAPHTGRDRVQPPTNSHRINISIHAPHTGRDARLAHLSVPVKQFQSTRPIRGATVPAFAASAVPDISIHAPHTGRDASKYGISCDASEFQSTRPIRGATSSSRSIQSTIRIFQSTRPIRGATIRISR